MKKIIYVTNLLLWLSICLSAQKYKPVTVLAGTRVSDYFPVEERYRYPEFRDGQIVMKNGSTGAFSINYDLLRGEIEFIQSPDTMTISKKKDVSYIAVAQDTFIYKKGYLEIIHNGKVKVWVKQYIKMKEIIKKNAFGQPSHVVFSDSYSVSSGGSYWDITPTDDIVFQKTVEYYIVTPEGEFVDFKKKTVLQIFPKKSAEIENYLKKNKVNFELKDDIIRFADYLDSLFV